MLQIYRCLILLFTLFFFTNLMALESNWSIGPESKVRLFSPTTHNNNNTEIILGLEYQLSDGWKTYWQSPGDAGFAQEIKWQDSTNVQSLEILWPTPKQFEILGINSIGYSNEVTFPLKINLKDSLKLTSIFLDINFLICKHICVPGKANLELNIPPGQGKFTSHAFYLEKTLSELPITMSNLDLIIDKKTDIFINKENISFYISMSSEKSFDDPSVFLHTEYGLPVVDPEIKLSNNNKNLEAKFIFDKSLIKDNNISTKFIVADKKQSFEINEIISKSSNNVNLSYNYLFILFIAFLGGIILNGMPCVLPVLSIKVLSMLKNFDKPYSIRKSFILTSLGIVSSFILLAFSFMLLRYLGSSVGWGMQFQQPLFLMMIAFILAFFSFNLLGLYEITLPDFVSEKIFKSLSIKDNTKDFFNGFLTTLMATPCSAPFVGTAITAAFTQSMFMMFFIFLFMSLGLALPYILVAGFPKILFYFPKPGKWMLYIKYFLGLLLLLTLVWIGNILLNHFNYYFIISIIILLIVTLLFNYFFKIKKTIFLISIIVFFTLPNFSFYKSNAITNSKDWLDFNSIKINDLIEKDNIVFVDITADWCATCQYNKIKVIDSKQISKLFSELKVVRVRGDWTKPNSEIEKFLQENNKFGIPFNIIYNKNNIEGIILPELLSKKDIIKALEKF